MKNILLLLIFVGVSYTVSAQGSLLGDLMNVAPVAAAETSTNEEAISTYTIIYDKRKAELDDDLNQLGETYKKEVGSVIERFSKVLAKGVDIDVKNEKTKVVTEVNSLTIKLRKDKQKAVTVFGNKIAPEIRDLPIDLRASKQKEIRNVSREMYSNFDEEYAGNQAIINQFKNTEHLTRTDGEGI